MPPLSVNVDPISYLLCYCPSRETPVVFSSTLFDGKEVRRSRSRNNLPHTITDVNESVAENLLRYISVTSNAIYPTRKAGYPNVHGTFSSTVIDPTVMFTTPDKGTKEPGSCAIAASYGIKAKHFSVLDGQFTLLV